MTSENPFIDLCLAIQAVRRDCEGLRSPLALATGAAASVYTHQLANTLRVLSDVRVRHLLADEVGLGKTVQALMILNALRSQRPDLRALVIVPDRLVAQWRDEILTRAHTAPIDEDRPRSEGQWVRLAWEGLLKKNERGDSKWSLADIDPDNYELLIVDELPRLRADIQDRLVRVAPSFQHLLVLTATPAFQSSERHAQLFAMLEPERTAIARWQTALDPASISAELATSDDLSRWPEWATSKIVETFLQRDLEAAAVSSVENDSREGSALAHCAYRRVIRTRRVDYSGILPQRRHVAIVTEPLGAEAERQALMWRYFQHLDTLATRVETVPLAKRVILSPPSLEQRVDFFRRKGHERDGLLELVKPLVHRSQGDSRLDALIDLLNSIWRKDPHERVLVAAQDNLTVDYLFDTVRARLPIVGPLLARIPLVAARVRQGMMTETVEDIAGFGNETNENIEAFQKGEAQVLFAPEATQVGLNLQCARILVLYSVPWRPEEVEQWIGRLDRIGNAAAFSADGKAKTVIVYTIAQRGLVDEKVVTVLQRFHVFEHSVNLDGDHLEEVASLIEAAALKPNSVNWKELEVVTETMAAEDEVQELNSALRASLPWTVDWAKSVRKRIDETPPFSPVLVELPDYASAGPRGWDRAFEGMIKLLRLSGEYRIWLNDDPAGGKFQTLWYAFGPPGIYGRRDVRSRIIFSFGMDPGHERNPRNAYAFVTRRGDLGVPPRLRVTLSIDGEQVQRPLRFLSFGDQLHDELVTGWASRITQVPSAINLTLPEDHKLFSSSETGLYLLRVTVLDPATALSEYECEEQAAQSIRDAARLTPEEKLAELVIRHIRQRRCALEADLRWIRSQIPAQFFVHALHLRNGAWRTVDETTISSLLNPMMNERPGLPHSSQWQPSSTHEKIVCIGLESLCGMDASAAKNAWSHQFPSFDRALALRKQVVVEEARDAERLAEFELAEANRRLDLARERGNPAQISRSASTQSLNSDLLDVTRVLWAERLAWLDKSAELIRELPPVERCAVLIQVRQL